MNEPIQMKGKGPDQALTVRFKGLDLLPVPLPGVEPGCGEAAAQAGIDRRFRALMTQLAQVSGWVVQKEVLERRCRWHTCLKP